MERDVLKKMLLEKGVSEEKFSLDGIKYDDALCLIHKNEGDWEWELLYNNHGKIDKIALFYDEHDACRYIYAEMKKKYGFE